jgi:hypothetical protein
MAECLSPILQVVKEILKDAGRKGLHVKSISEQALAQNKNMGLSVEDFQKKIQNALNANLKLKTIKPSFAQVKWDSGVRKGKPRQGWYRVKEERIQPPETKIVPPSTASSFMGKAGEYAVMSELLFWEYNVSQMTVDDGIDLVASKHNKFFFIQVKTATRQENGRYLFTIAKSSFSKYQGQNVYYTFVLRQDVQNGYIILPGNMVDSFLRTGIIKDSTTMSITITVNDKKTLYKLNNKFDVTQYYGRFGELIV